MPFDWNHFLSLAEELAARPDEACKRTAISRAYYSVFNLAFARAETTVGPKPEGESFHRWCWHQYTRSVDSSCRQLGIDGDRMKMLRVRADYKEEEIPHLDARVRGILQDARQFVANLASLDPMHPLP